MAKKGKGAKVVKKVKATKGQPRKAATPRKAAKGKKKAVRPARVFVYALALAALGGGGYLVYGKVNRRMTSSDESIAPGASSDTVIINNTLPTSYASFTSRMLSSATDSFPLKRGSRGPRVTQLQQALKKTTPAISVDGQFGIQTATALRYAGYSETVDEALFNKIISNSNTSIQLVFNPAMLATALYSAAQAKNLDQVMSGLKQLKSVSEYSSVNEYYKKQSFISRTIVTDLLEYAFKLNEAAKTQIKNEFLRIGLKVNNVGTWSLQGIRLFKDLITIRETVVIDGRNNRIPVRGNTILGDEQEVANGMTWFRSIDNTVLGVPTQDVKYT